MGRPARYIPESSSGTLVEISCRAIGGRALPVPAPNPRTFNEIVAGVLGRALEVAREIELCSAVVAGNHHHILAVVHEQLARSR